MRPSCGRQASAGSRSTWWSIGVIGALILAACSPADDAAVEALEERVIVLEVELDRLAVAEDDPRLNDLDAAVADLEGELASAAETLTTLSDDLEDLTADIGLLLDALTVLEEDLDRVADELRAEVASLADRQETSTAELRRAVSAVDSRVDQATGQIEELRTLIVTVRDRLDRCQADGSC